MVILTWLGSSVEAGICNIVGTAEFTDIRQSQSFTGAFYAYAMGSGAAEGGGSSSNRPDLGFDASLSNEIYGNSDTVTPLSLSILFCIKYE